MAYPKAHPSQPTELPKTKGTQKRAEKDAKKAAARAEKAKA